MYSALKRLLVGPPLASTEEQHTRLGRPTALTVFASDAISSTAYATEEVLLVLIPAAGLAAFDTLIPISMVVGLLLLLVITSYRQTIYAYPSGGGSYVVSRENLGQNPSLVAGAALLVDYVLTVAVSVSAGVAAMTSAIEPWRPYRVQMCVGAIVVMMLANLRGTKESGRLFAPPVFAYLASLTLLVGVGIYQVFVNGLGPMDNEYSLRELGHIPEGDPMVFGGLTLLILLRGFSSGAVALTGVEAISNGVPAFKKPESHNAATTLVTMGLILGVFFMGISYLASHIHPGVLHPGDAEYETLLSLMAGHIYGGKNVLYYVLQFATFAILILAANTAFADFPRVSSIIAADGFLPRQLASRGDRLVYSNGIFLLALVASLLVVGFSGDTSALIPLYAVGVFLGFTLSQSGMVVHHQRLQEKGWRTKRAMNAVGALATFVVLGVVVVSKFAIGAWIPVLLIPIIVVVFKSVHRHYLHVARSIQVPEGYRARRRRHTVVVLVGNVHRGVLDAIGYAMTLSPDRLMALTVVHDRDDQERVQAQWEQFAIPIELRTEYSPYRELTGPVLSFVDALDEEWPDDIVTVVVPEFVLDHWWEQLLHNQSALVLRARLRLRPNTVVTAVPIHLHTEADAHSVY